MRRLRRRLRRAMAATAVAAAVVLLGCGNDGQAPGGAAPTTVPIAPVTSDVVFVVNGASHTLSVLDADRDEVVGTIRILNAYFPHHVYASPDRALLAVAVPGVDLSGGHGGHGGGGGAGALLVLDSTTGATRAARWLGAPNHNGVFSPDGAEIWTALTTTLGSVLVLDPTTLAALDTIPAGDGPSEVTFSRDGSRAFVANTGSNDVTVIDPATKEVVATIPVGEGPVGAWPGGDGRMYVDNEAGRSLTAIDVATLAVVRTYDLGFTPGYAATGPNGEVWVTNSDGGEVVFYAGTSDVRLGAVATGAGAHAVIFAADGGKAYVTNQMDGTVSVIDVASRAVTKTVTVGAKPNGLVFRRAIS